MGASDHDALDCDCPEEHSKSTDVLSLFQLR